MVFSDIQYSKEQRAMGTYRANVLIKTCHIPTLSYVLLSLSTKFRMK